MPGGANSGAGSGAGSGGMVPIFFWNLTLFFDIQFKNTSNLILLSFKVPSERCFHNVLKQVKNFKIESEVVNISVGHSVIIYQF